MSGAETRLRIGFIPLCDQFLSDRNGPEGPLDPPNKGV